ncbi:MAG TPA: hypothetical protein VN803_05945 [Gemmatimonadales bacterium]|nr:hypothetical protein [Gemmatimonadales bacterium]
MTRTLCAALLAAACFTAEAAAQQPAQRQVDSLGIELRILRLRLDSVRAELARLARRSPRDTALAPADEDLAAIRAAAAQTIGRDTTQTADTASARRFSGRERNQSQLNPEISVTGDVRAYASNGDPGNYFDPHEFEVGFQSALDPYSHTKIFVAFGNGEVDVEEGYAYWIGLPGKLRLDLGKYRQPFGELNRWHLHAVPETEYPLALTTYFGGEGLAGTGVSLYRAFGGLGTHELTVQVTSTAGESDEVLFASGGRPTFLAHLLNFWQLNRSTYMQLGGSALYGTNPDSSLRTAVGGVDFRLTWRPPAQALYREWTLRGELLAFRKQIANAGPTRLGGYVSSTYKLDQRWIAGVRYDYVESPEFGEITQQIIPSLTMWQSEWVFLRGQYRWEKVANATATNQFALQAVWAIGPHKHETY